MRIFVDFNTSVIYWIGGIVVFQSAMRIFVDFNPIRLLLLLQQPVWFQSAMRIFVDFNEEAIAALLSGQLRFQSAMRIFVDFNETYFLNRVPTVQCFNPQCGFSLISTSRSARDDLAQ